MKCNSFDGDEAATRQRRTGINDRRLAGGNARRRKRKSSQSSPSGPSAFFCPSRTAHPANEVRIRISFSPQPRSRKRRMREAASTALRPSTD